MNDCQIDFLSFKYWGLKEHSNWETKLERCHNILSGIEKCYNLIFSLNTLFLKYTFSEDSRQRFVSEIVKNIQNYRKLILLYNPFLTPKLNIHLCNPLKVQLTIYLLKSHLEPVCSPSHMPSYPIKQPLNNSIIVISSISIHTNLPNFLISKPSNKKILKLIIWTEFD